jgi:hypothetical protein
MGDAVAPMCDEVSAGKDGGMSTFDFSGFFDENEE